MSQSKWLILFVITFISLFLLNFIAHGVILSNFNADDLAGIRKANPEQNMLPMVFNYLIQAAALLYFIPRLTKNATQTKTALTGFALGGLIFLVGGLNNVFLLERWPLFVLLSDTIANGIVYGLIALELRYLHQRLA